MVRRKATVHPVVRMAWARNLVLGAALALGACGGAPDVEIRSVELRVAEKANQDSPIPVDLVLVGHPDLVDRIIGLTAVEWFAQRSQFRRDHPAELTIYSWELVPGQTVPRQPVSRPDSLWAAVVFANYSQPGPHRLRVDTHGDPTLRLGEEDVTIAGQ